MKKKIILLTLMFMIPFVISAKELKIDWINSLSGDGTESGDVIRLNDGYLLYGSTTSSSLDEFGEIAGYSDSFIIKYNNDGEIMWKHILGGGPDENTGNNGTDHFKDFKYIPGKGFLLLIQSNSNDFFEHKNKGKIDSIILMYDLDGNLLWQKGWGGDSGDNLNSFYILDNDYFLVYGSSPSTDIEGFENKGLDDIVILKYDYSGDLIWQRTWGGNNYEFINKIFLNNSNELVILVDSQSDDIDGLVNKGEFDIVYLKYDLDGNLLLQKNFGGDGREYVYEVFEYGDEFWAVSYTFSISFENYDLAQRWTLLFLKFNMNGDLLELKEYNRGNGTITPQDFLRYDDNIYVLLQSDVTNLDGVVNKGLKDSIVIKYDNEFNIIWQKNYGGDKNDSFAKIVNLDNSGLYILGQSQSTDISGITNKGKSDAIMFKIDYDGNLLSSVHFGGSGPDVFRNLFEEKNGYSFFGIFKSSDIDGLNYKGDNDLFLLKYFYQYFLEIIEPVNGTVSAIQNENLGVISAVPDDGYEIDKVVVLDSNGNMINVSYNKEGNYFFDLYDDVKIEVIFKEMVNPKTGFLDFFMILFIGFSFSLCGFYLVKHYNENYQF